MAPSIYFINPAADFPTYFNAENYFARNLRRATQMADLAIPTLAALTPPDFEVRICDENIDPVDAEWVPDYVGITGKITQHGRMLALAQDFRGRGSTVIIGGPYASLSPEVLAPHCDILVRGEIEEIAPKFFEDLRSGNYSSEYEGTKPDLSTSPIPRWDLYNNDRAVMGTLQTSRGCPFECEFCDVIQYAGRKQRHKAVGQVLQELDVLYHHGYRSIFLADDNFTVFRARAKELLEGLREWNQRREAGKVNFLTQVSIDAARDSELLDMCAEAGLTTVFIGIETPNEESLRESKKRQNLKVNLVDQVHKFLTHGISIIGGMIVGFDADGPDIFRRQYEFAMASAIPIFSVGALVAPAATPLHARMKREGRLKQGGSEVAAVPWTTNIVHRNMTEEQWLGGLRWLANNLYSPESFGDRLLAFIDIFGERRDPKRHDPIRPGLSRSVDRDSLEVLFKVRELGAAEEKMWTRIMAATKAKPVATPFALISLMQYMQIRHMYEQGQFWEPRLAVSEAAPATAAAAPLISLRTTARVS
jgi:radical SAM superfamily enzyme YgiQ (UPF0313 family)